ncbi:methyl-accepting chemotaxis protein [Caldibacillus debilis]|uniref:methyl-accepting chemotaxis protein n=1 Tax=Caldibacillus debilis TaxID=301148 RepID=UPI000E376B9A|nr:methyl-accepting chemotaxis protein [Caldibacillus debilis]REJ31226.1 MAG: chemotaxis protein [Caldibacillus debilis]
MKRKSFFGFLSSIKSKLIFFAVLFLTVPAVIFSVFTYYKTSTSLNAVGETNLKNSVRMTIEMIDALNDEVEQGKISLEEAQEKVKIAMLGEKDENGIRPVNKKIDLGKDGHIIAFDQNGVAVAHPDKEGQNLSDRKDSKGVKFVREILKAGDNGGGFVYFDYPRPGKNKAEKVIAYAETEPNWGWTICVTAFMKDFNQPAHEILIFLAITAGIMLLLEILIVWRYAGNISKPIRRVTEKMIRLADGDLTQEKIEIRSRDETGQLAEAVNIMAEKLKEMLRNISSASVLISSHSEELAHSANEVKTGAEQVAQTMEELAAGSGRQASSSSEMSEKMKDFAAKVQESSLHGEKMEQSSKEILEMAGEGNQLMDASAKQMEKIDRIMKETVDKVQMLNGQAQEINKLIYLIRDIADQTNLLSLNAAIEAARAGEQGKGFAVVADEIRKLAEQVAVSVSEITEIIQNIQKEFQNVTEALQEGYQEVEMGTAQIEITKERFHSINESIRKMAENIQTISRNLADIASSSQEINGSIQEIAAIAEESAAGIQQTSASAEQISSSMEEISKSSDQLSKLTDNLNELVGRFKLSS